LSLSEIRMKNRKKHFLFFLGHPAHFHLFKNTILTLKEKGHRISIVIKTKDILEDLLRASGMDYINILPKGRKDGKWGIVSSVLKKNWYLFQLCLKDRPDLMLGTSVEIAHIGTLLRIPSINFSEDDAAIVPLLAKYAYPYSNYVMSPVGCNNGNWDAKTIEYLGYHKLAYLHPKRFRPDIKVVEKYFSPEKPYYLIRFAKLSAHHDGDAKGFSTDVAQKVIDLLNSKGNVYITSERELEPQFERYRLKIDPMDIHHVMYYADLYLGDSQSMAVEAAMLGVPSIRFSNFSGRINVLEELEHKYQLTFGVPADHPQKLLELISRLLKSDNISATFQNRREKMLSEKIDVTAFFIDFFESYPLKVEQHLRKSLQTV